MDTMQPRHLREDPDRLITRRAYRKAYGRTPGDVVGVPLLRPVVWLAEQYPSKKDEQGDAESDRGRTIQEWTTYRRERQANRDAVHQEGAAGLKIKVKRNIIARVLGAREVHQTPRREDLATVAKSKFVAFPLGVVLTATLGPLGFGYAQRSDNEQVRAEALAGIEGRDDGFELGGAPEESSPGTISGGAPEDGGTAPTTPEGYNLAGVLVCGPELADVIITTEDKDFSPFRAAERTYPDQPWTRTPNGEAVFSELQSEVNGGPIIEEENFTFQVPRECEGWAKE